MKYINRIFPMYISFCKYYPDIFYFLLYLLNNKVNLKILFFYKFNSKNENPRMLEPYF